MSRIALAISGWDPSAGAGAAADLKTFAAWGVYGQAAITSLTVQNSRSVTATNAVPPEHLREVLAALRDDNPFHAVKIGMLGTATHVRTVAAFLRTLSGVPVVLDPVLRSTSGRELLDADGLAALHEELLPLATWITPNLAELAALAGLPVTGAAEVEAATAALASAAPQCHVLATGGHLDHPDDYLAAAGPGVRVWLSGSRVETNATHGTGCTLASSLAAIAARWPLADPQAAVRAAKVYLEGAMRNAPRLGPQDEHGHGPMQHFWRPVPDSLD